MTRKARIWMGLTLLMVLVFNYLMFGYPLFKKKAYIQKRSQAILVVKNADDEYILEILRKEKEIVDRKIRIINCIGISFAIIITSWTVFGLIVHKKSKS